MHPVIYNQCCLCRCVMSLILCWLRVCWNTVSTLTLMKHIRYHQTLTVPPVYIMSVITNWIKVMLHLYRLLNSFGC